MARQLAPRTLQELKLCTGPVLMMGTGTHMLAKRLCPTSTIAITRAAELFAVLKPTFEWLVEFTLEA